MKKLLMITLLSLCATVAVHADEAAAVGFWFNAPSGIGSTSVDGLGIGLPILANHNLRGASLALCGNDSAKTSGAQLVLFGYNRAQSLFGLQFGMINFLEKQHDDFALQLGLYNQSSENGVQLGFINNGRNNATLQLGLININKGGLLPVMIFINLGSGLFD